LKEIIKKNWRIDHRKRGDIILKGKKMHIVFLEKVPGTQVQLLAQSYRAAV
jgi:hypothetical protein